MIITILVIILIIIAINLIDNVIYYDYAADEGEHCHLYIYEDMCKTYGEENLPYKHNCKDYECCNDCPFHY